MPLSVQRKFGNHFDHFKRRLLAEFSKTIRCKHCISSEKMYFE